MNKQLTFILCFLLSLFSLMAEAKTAATVCSITGDSMVCENDIEAYTSGYTGSYTYTWGAYGGLIIGSSATPTISVNWGYAGTGQVTMIVKNSLNQVVCTKIMTIAINPLPKPEITPSFVALCSADTSKGGTVDQKRESPCLTICDSSWVTYTTDLHPGSTYTWTVSGAISYTSSSNTATVHWGAAGIGSVKVIETTAAGCIVIDERCIEILPSPDAIFTTLPAAIGGIVNICKNQNVFFDNASLTGGGSPIYTYEWIFGDGSSQILTAPTSGDLSHTYNTAGTYTAMLIVTNECGCKDTASIIVIVDSSPGPDIFCISTVCPGSPISYSTSAICSTYNWVATNGTIIGSSTSQNVIVQWSGVSPAVLSLSVPCGSFCPSPSTLVIPVIPTSAYYSGDTTLCFGACGELFLDCAIPIDSIIWHLPPGLTASSDTINTHNLKFCAGYAPVSGNIWVEYFHNTNGSTVDLECGGNLFIPIKVLPQFYFFGSNTFCEGDPFSYSPYIPSSTTLNWTIKNSSGTTLTTSTLPSTSPFSGSWAWGAGTYSVTVTDVLNKHCNKTEQLLITVNPRPAAPTIVGQDTVCPNNTYTYTSLVSGALETVNWTVVGGTPLTSNGNTINVKWGPAPSYIVTATAKDVTTGCVSLPTSKTVFSALPMVASIINGPDTVCSNGFAIYSTPSSGSNYEWSINPTIAGSVGTGQYSNAINVQWNNYTGNAWVVLKRTLCNQSRKDSIKVYVRPQPAPTISAPTTICQNASFTVTASGGAGSYAWDFGDGSIPSGGISASHMYTTPGNFVITLTSYFGGNCPITTTTTHSITVIPAPITNISTGDPTLYCNTPPLSISTTMTVSTSVGTTGWNWYKAPSGTSIGTLSSLTATTIGTYYVVSYNAAGCSTTTTPIVIDTISCDTCRPLSYALSFNKFRLGCNTDSFRYTASSVTSLAWNFGDKFNLGTNTATGNSVLHTYTEPGVYQIKLCGKVKSNTTVATDSCLVCVYKNDTINYVPDFYPIINCVNNSPAFTVTFKNTTKKYTLAPAPTYKWFIGVTGPFSGTDYTTTLAAGTYTVRLEIDGVCSFLKVITLVAPTQASFTAADSVCVGSPVQFTNTASPILGSSWTFGDGASSLLTNPYRSYSTAGLFTVTQTVTNQYGCTDTAQRRIRVLPNTLNGTLSLSGPHEFCFGDSVQITANPTGGYAPYSYLWNTTAVTQSIKAFYTGNYGVDLYDSKGCFHKIADTLILVNPIPNPTILGDLSFCFGDQVNLIVASTYPENNILASYDGSPLSATYSNVLWAPNSLGSHQVIVEVINAFGCSARDTHNYVVHPKPNISIATTGSLCEGDINILVASSTSTNVKGFYWSTGLINDSLVTSVPNNYIATVVDSNGCEAQASVSIHRLPDLCGLMTGCYEICDTVTSLVWYAPKGYASYQWYYNGTAISGATSDTIHIPLYQSGSYSVVISNGFGCTVTSDDIDIEFVPCGGCKLQATFKIECGPINTLGNQTYNVTFTLNNTLSAGASVSLSSPDGTVTGLFPATAALGLNTFTAVFTDIPPVTGLACFTIRIWNQENRCDTTFCVELPDCKQRECGTQISVKKPFDCVGYDGSGNPQYYGCVNVYWPGSNGSTITLSAPNSSFSPNPQTVNNGTNNICFTYTDLPSYNPGFVKIYAYFYDAMKHTTCCDSFIIEYKPCKERCQLGVVGLCAHCHKQTQNGEWTYKLEMDVTNPFGTNANVSILPIAAGTFGIITPNPVPMGTTTISTIFTDLGTPDSIICFRVLLTNPLTGEVCYRDLCISLPPCDRLSVAPDFELESVKLYPNPAKEFVKVALSANFGAGTITLSDIDGRMLQVTNILASDQSLSVDVSQYSAGIYFVEISKESGATVRKRLIIE